jgi:uncharacterized protein (DUF697 family)/GTP-binding protein EngB required for normal cell division
MPVEKFKPVILVCGKSGAGKTSLIQAVTDSKTVPDSAIGIGLPVTKGINVYETDVATYIDAEGMVAGQTVEEYRSFLQGESVNRLANDNVDGIVTSVWYCIDGSGGRVQEADKQIYSSFGHKAFVVVTKSDRLRNKNEFQAIRQELGDIPDDRIVLASSVRETGLSCLIERTRKAIALDTPQKALDEFRASWDMYFGQRQQRWIARCDEEADSYIRWGAGRSFAIAAVAFLPVSDVIPLSLNEAYMIMRIGAAYGESVGDNVVGALAGVAAGSIGGKILATLMPPIAKSAVAASVTYGLGKVAKSYFRSGKTLSKEKLREEFLKAKKEGKKQKWEPISEAE